MTAARDIVVDALTRRIADLERFYEQDCEDLFGLIHGAAEWGDDEVEDVLTRWRKRRGDQAMTDWSWWARPAGEDDRYQYNAATRDAVIAEARRDGEAGPLDLIEARDWADEIDIEERNFAEVRNAEKGAV